MDRHDFSFPFSWLAGWQRANAALVAWSLVPILQLTKQIDHCIFLFFERCADLIMLRSFISKLTVPLACFKLLLGKLSHVKARACHCESECHQKVVSTIIIHRCLHVTQQVVSKSWHVQVLMNKPDHHWQQHLTQFCSLLANFFGHNLTWLPVV